MHLGIHADAAVVCCTMPHLTPPWVWRDIRSFLVLFPPAVHMHAASEAHGLSLVSELIRGNVRRGECVMQVAAAAPGHFLQHLTWVVCS